MTQSSNLQAETSLVSVCVITYNSSRWILETLDSIFNQTYHPIELIISDDCSQDDTVVLCQTWLDTHHSRFVDSKILTIDKNTGISANCNRAHNATTGRWVKGVAGDDMLLPNAIENNVNYILGHPNVDFLFSKVIFINDKSIPFDYPGNLFKYHLFALSPKEMHNELLKGNFIPATTFFYDRTTFQKLKLNFDEEIPLLDDYPLWLRITAKNVRLHFMDKDTVLYRIHNSNTATGHLSESYKLTLKNFYLKYLFPSLVKRNPKELLTYIRIKSELEIRPGFWTFAWHSLQKVATIRKKKSYR